MKCNLILVEGLPGTGKTTWTECIYKLFLEHGLQAEYLLEDDKKNPSNYYCIAGIPKKDFPYHSLAIPIIAQTDNYIFIDLHNCEEKAANQLHCYDLGDEFNKNISVSEYIRCTLEWWNYWVSNIKSDTIFILDSAFMQCPINELIFRGASDTEINSYIQAIWEIMKPLNPICFYLRRENATIAINFAKEAKGECWAEGIERLAQSEFPDLFERRFQIETRLLSSFSSIVCDVNGSDWSDVKSKGMFLSNYCKK